MKPTFLLVLVLSAAAIGGGLAAEGAAAQDVTITTNDTETEADECTETINNYTSICDGRLEGDEVVIDIHTEGQQAVTVTEAFRKGSGILRQSRIVLQPGVNTIRMTVTVDGGAEGVTIAAGNVLYQKEVTGSDSTGLPSTSIVNGVLIGIATMILGLGIAVNRKRAVEHMKVESGWED